MEFPVDSYEILVDSSGILLKKGTCSTAKLLFHWNFQWIFQWNSSEFRWNSSGIKVTFPLEKDNCTRISSEFYWIPVDLKALFPLEKHNFTRISSEFLVDSSGKVP